MDPALITGGTAVATGLLGYLGAQLQHRGEQARIDVERGRLRLERAKADAETSAVNQERLERQLERRRDLYHEFLGAAERAWEFSTRREPVTEPDLDAWWIEYQALRRRLRIGASEAVVESFGGLNSILIDIFNDLVVVIDDLEAGVNPGAEAAYGGRLDVWGEHSEAFTDALRGVELAMRDDLDVSA